MGMPASATGALKTPVGLSSQPRFREKHSPAASAVADMGKREWLVAGRVNREAPENWTLVP